MQIATLPINGLAQGAQPIISYNFGAKQIDRVKKAFKLLFICAISYTMFIWVSLNLFPEVFVSIFNNKKEVIEMTSWSIKIFFGGIFLFGAQMACQQTFLALGQAKISLMLALLRKVILLIPLVFILPLLFEDKLKAVLFAEPIADILAGLTTIVCFSIFYKKTLSKIDKEDTETIKVS